MREHGADDYRRGHSHVAGAAHDVAKEIEHENRDRTCESDVRVGEGRVEDLPSPAHPLEDERRGGQHHSRENRREDHGERERVARERVGALAVPRAQRARDRRGDATAHAARGGGFEEHARSRGDGPRRRGGLG